MKQLFIFHLATILMAVGQYSIHRTAEAAVTVIGDVTPDPLSLGAPNQTLIVGNNADGELTVDAGSGIASTGGKIADSAGVTGVVTVDGPGSTWISSASIVTGLSGSGTLNITNGGMVSNSLSGIGLIPGASGVVNVDGVGSIWNNGENLGVLNQATLNITGGGTVNSPTASLNYPTSLANVIGAGSTWVNSGELHIGAGALVIDDEGVVDTDTISFGNTNGSGALSISNDGVLNVSGDVEANKFPDNQLVFNNGTLNARNVFHRYDYSVASHPSNLQGVGTINAEGWILKENIVLSGPGDLPSQLTLSDHPGQNISVNVSWTGQGTFGSERDTAVKVNNGFGIASSSGYVGYGFGVTHNSSVTIEGAGSTWNTSGEIYINAESTLSIERGGSITADSVFLNSAGRLNYVFSDTSDVPLSTVGDVLLRNVNLNNRLSVEFDPGLVIKRGDVFKLIEVGGNLSGTFGGLSEGTNIGTFGGLPMVISYVGGDGNDVTLTAGEPAGKKIVSWGRLNSSMAVENTPTDKGYAAIDGGGYHMVALTTTGTVVAWGSDTYGEVSNLPIENDFTAVAAGTANSYALHSDGSIEAWGRDTFGSVSNAPNGTGFTSIAAGGSGALALDSNGVIHSWGFRSGPGEQVYPSGGSGFTAIARGALHGLAIASDGSLVSWGSDSNGQVSNTPLGDDFIAISAGNEHSLALREDGSIVAWGSDYEGEVSGKPIDNGYIMISAGWGHSIALKSDGSIVSWGNGAKWNGGYIEAPSGVGFTAITAGGWHAAALQMLEFGDFDEDGDIDGRDFLTWQRNPSIGLLQDWHMNYGFPTSNEVSSTIPEPTSYGLVLIASVLVSAGRFLPVPDVLLSRHMS